MPKVKTASDDGLQVHPHSQLINYAKGHYYNSTTNIVSEVISCALADGYTLKNARDAIKHVSMVAAEAILHRNAKELQEELETHTNFIVSIWDDGPDNLQIEQAVLLSTLAFLMRWDLKKDGYCLADARSDVLGVRDERLEKRYIDEQL